MGESCPSLALVPGLLRGAAGSRDPANAKSPGLWSPSQFSLVVWVRALGVQMSGKFQDLLGKAGRAPQHSVPRTGPPGSCLGLEGNQP